MQYVGLNYPVRKINHCNSGKQNHLQSSLMSHCQETAFSECFPERRSSKIREARNVKVNFQGYVIEQLADAAAGAAVYSQGRLK